MVFEMVSDVILGEGLDDWENSIDKSEEKKLKFPINISTDPDLLDVSLLVGNLKIVSPKMVKRETKMVDLSKRSKGSKSKGSGLF
jgi:hypothetical protein